MNLFSRPPRFTLAAGAVLALIAPSLAFAYTPTTLPQLGGDIINIINTVFVPLIFAVSFITFLYGVAQAYVFSRGDPEKIKKGHQIVLWGIIGFFVMRSVGGLVNFLSGTFFFNTAVPQPPQL